MYGDFLDYWDIRYLDIIDDGIGRDNLYVAYRLKDPTFHMGEETFERLCGASGTSLASASTNKKTCCGGSSTASTTSSWRASRACAIEVFADLDTTSPRSDREQGFELLSKYVRFLAEQFDGTHTFTGSDGTERLLPNVVKWWQFLEINQTQYMADEITLTDWDTPGNSEITITQAELHDWMHSVVDDIKAVRSDDEDLVFAFPDVLPRSDNFETVTDVAYYADPDMGLAAFDADKYSYLGLHAYPYVPWAHPEPLLRDWDYIEGLLETTASSSGAAWGDMRLKVDTSSNREKYEPHCIRDGWTMEYDETQEAPLSRGLGEEEEGKLVPRQLLVALSLPSEIVSRFCVFSKEQEYTGSLTNPYECWEADQYANFNIMNRVLPTGRLSGYDEPTYFEASPAVVAMLLLAEHLGSSSPVASRAMVNSQHHRSVNEPYYSAVFQLPTDGEWALALWWFQDYMHTNLDCTFLSDLYETNCAHAWQAFVLGDVDTGFTETRRHKVHLNGFASISNIVQVSLEDGSETSLSNTTDENGLPVLDVVFGERPILVKFSGTRGDLVVDEDHDGIADHIDCLPGDSSGGYPTRYFRDSDGDDVGTVEDTQDSCTGAPTGYVSVIHDCNDSDPAVSDLGTWYFDGDGDGYGDPNRSLIECNAPAGYVADAQDCNDTNAALKPGSAETCDLIDNDCDGTADEDSPAAIAWHEDRDRDGFGAQTTALRTCRNMTSSGYVVDNRDTNDNCPARTAGCPTP